MYIIRLSTDISAPAMRCFDLARSVDAHLWSSESTGERAVAGRLSGLMELGDQVTWEARHFGIWQRLTSQITELRPPVFFQDRMIRGAFASLEHDHHFMAQADRSTTMTDIMRFAAPFRPAGWLAERLVLGRYMRTFLRKRSLALKSLAETEGWRQFCPSVDA